MAARICVEGRLLRAGSACAARAPGRRRSPAAPASSVTEALARQRARRGAGVLHRASPAPSGCASPGAVPERRAARAPAWCSFCALRPAVRQFDAQPRRRRAQRIALRLHVLDHDEALASRASASPCRPAAASWRDTPPRAAASRACAGSAPPGSSRAGIEQQLARGVAAGVGQRLDLARAGSRHASGSMPRSTSPSGAQ